MSELSAVGPVPPHEVLLWLAGRIDDDLLAWTRELIAVGEDDQAVELITATLIADRVSLPPMLRDWVVERSSSLNLEPAADDALPPAADDAPLHIFVAELADGLGATNGAAATLSERLRAALAGVAERHLRAGSWWLAWRLTPAGAAPGPLPHPVILVELGPDAGTSAEVVAYQVADAVQRSGLTASVEVFVAGAALPEYHRSALREARGEAPAAPYKDAPAAPAQEPVSADLDADADAGSLASGPAGAQHRLQEPSTQAGPTEPSAPDDEEAGETADVDSESWSDEWVTGEWSESPGGAQLAGLSDTERALLAQLQEELTAREAEARPKRANGGSSPKRPGVAEPPGLAG